MAARSVGQDNFVLQLLGIRRVGGIMFCDDMQCRIKVGLALCWLVCNM